MKKILSAILALTLMNSVSARVNPTQVPDILTEGTVVTLSGKTINSKGNPLKVNLVTVDGNVVSLTPILNKKGTQAQVLLPTIPSDVDSLVQVTLKISGGDVSSSVPQEFARILAKQPAGFNGEDLGGGIGSTATSLPSGTSSGIISQGPAGPRGENGATGSRGLDGTPGPQGPIGPVPLSYPGSSIVGDVASAVSFTGSLAGDVTGTQSSTSIANSVVLNKQLSGSYAAAAGVVAGGDSIQTAIAKLDGNITVNSNSIISVNGSVLANKAYLDTVNGKVATNTANIATNTSNIATNASNIAGLTSVLGTPTSSNTANQIVKRDASGNFAANVITANSFSGNVTGSAATFTGSLAGDVGGTQSATTIADSVVTGKRLLNNYTASAGTLANGDTIYSAIRKLDGNEQASALILANATDANTTGRLVKRDGSGNFAANVISATTFSGNLSGLINSGSSSQPNIVSLSGVQNLGSGGVPLTIYGPVTANALITGTITNANTAANFSGSLAGDVSGTQTTTVIGNDVVTYAKLQNVSATDRLLARVSANAGDVEEYPFTDFAQSLVDDADATTARATLGLAIGTDVQAYDADLSALGGVTSAVDALPYFTGSATATTTTLTTFGRSLIDDADAATARSTLGVVIGSDVQAYNANLTGFAGETAPAGDVVGTTDTQTLSSKKLVDATVTIVDDADATKQVKLEVSGVTTATTRTLTVPNADGTIALTNGLTPIAIGAPAQAASTVDVGGLNFVKLNLTGDLDTLSNGVDGQRVTIVFTAVSGDDVTEGTGNIELNASTDFTPNIGSVIELIYDADTSKWYEVARSQNN